MAGDTKRNVSILIQAKDQASGVLKGLNGALVGVAAVMAAVTAAAAAMGVAMAKAVEAAKGQQVADVKLAAALRTLGQNTREVRDDLTDFANQLQDLTTIDDRVVKSVLGILGSLGQLEGEGLKRATVATLDFAAAVGQDAVRAALLVAKAADGYVSALTRYGIKVDESIPKTEQFTAALDQMEMKVGGLAEAMGKTFEGRLVRVGNNLNDATELIGDAVVKSESFNEVLDFMADAFKDLQPAIIANLPTIQAFAEFVLRSSIVVVRALTEMVEQFFRLPGLIKQAFEALPDIPTATIVAARLVEDGVGRMIQAYDELRADVIRIAGDLQAPGEKAAAVFDGLGEEINDLLKRLEELKGASSDIEGGLGNLDLGDPGESIGRIREKLDELAAASQKVGEDFAEAVSLFELGPEAGGIGEEQFDALVENIKAVGQTIIDNGGVIKDLDGNVIDFLNTVGRIPEEVIPLFQAAEQQIVAVGDTIADTLVEGGRRGAQQLGATFVDAAFGAEKAFAGFAKAFLKQIAAMIVQALILKTISAAFSFGGSAVAGGGGFSVISGLGGLFAGAAPSIPTSIQPELQLASAPAPVRRVALGQDIQIFNRIEAAPDRTEQAIELMEEINELVERRGFRLTSSEVVG